MLRLLSVAQLAGDRELFALHQLGRGEEIV